jgi:Uma2 family endonuclease
MATVEEYSNIQTFLADRFYVIALPSPEDAAVDLRIKVNEYLRFGVRYVWVIDPGSSTGEVHGSAGVTPNFTRYTLEWPVT